MAGGTSAAVWLTLPEVGVSDLDDAALPDPTEAEWDVEGLLLSGARDTLADPRPYPFEKSGIPGLIYAGVWFEHIHIFPREQDLGSVVSLQEIQVEVWNAYRSRARVLNDIVVTGPAGMEVDDHLGTPATYPATDSQLYTVSVDADGDPQINNSVAWEFEGTSEPGTTLSVVGFRLIPFPYPPNMARAVEESFGYLTDLIVAYDGSEQRVQLREVPVGAIAYSIYLNDLRQAQMAGAILFGNQPRAFGVARWQFQTPLGVGVVAEDTEVYCTTDDIPFIAGGLVMLWTSPFAWEVQTIDSVESDHLVLTSGLQGAWSATVTAVVPMVVGRLSNDERISWESLLSISQALRFDVDGFTP